MGADAALELVDSLVHAATGGHLSDLQRTIFQQVWQGQKYFDIASRFGYTEGHVKDVASQLWRLLSKACGEKVTKATLKSAIQRRLRSVKSLTPPFQTPETTPIQTDKRSLLGREAEIATLDTLIGQNHRAIVIQGEGGLGKTTLAQHYLASRPFDRVLELPMARETADIVPAERVVEEWLRQDFGIEPGRELGVTLDRLRRQLQSCRVGVLIDNLEPALDSRGRFVTGQGRYRELLRVLIDHRTPTVTLLTSRDRLCEPGLSVVHYRLPSLSPRHWARCFQRQGLVAEDAVLEAIHAAYGGNAKAMEILSGVILADFEGDVATYWQSQSQNLLSPVELQNLVDSQVRRLQALDPAAHQIYCRLGAYRYQQVPVPRSAIAALMTDFPPERHGAILTSLRNRSLLEQAKDRYWLHPVVRADAIARLRTTPDWERANRWAAQFWSDQTERILTLEDAIQALEAYYHYVAIGDYAAAGRVLLHSRDNQWRQFLPLGSTLYRMGLIQPVLEATTTVLERISPDSSDASELYNLLGDLCWITGQISRAIAHQQQSLAIAQSCFDQTPAEAPHRRYCLTLLAIDAQLSLGLYHLDRWELAAAASQFQTVIDQSAHGPHQRWAEKATACLALVMAHQGNRSAAAALAAQTYGPIAAHPAGRNAFFVYILGQTFCLLEQYDLATELLTSAAVAAETGHFLQIQANALVGLGQVARQRQDWPTAIAQIETAIALLDDLGAKCDLAEAHYQLGLTQQGASSGRPQVHFAQAIRLLGEIQAPKRLARAQAQMTALAAIPPESSAP
ncbi:NB-ARC domain-containing protein [filamentous cyanobacterium CCP5]|nr:NB-ARC domain-containing protein [filamentous cyanobacterium CCP5]